MLINLFDRRSYLSKAASSWLDDYIDWSQISDCCKYFKTNESFCPHSQCNYRQFPHFFSQYYHFNFRNFFIILYFIVVEGCQSCKINITNYNRPTEYDFRKYLPYFLQDIPDERCAKAGRAAYFDVRFLSINISELYFHWNYGYVFSQFLLFSSTFLKLLLTNSQALNYKTDENGLIDVRDSYFMGYHTPLKKSSDWYEALRFARNIADNITIMINSLAYKDVTVFPYRFAHILLLCFYTFWNIYSSILSNSNFFEFLLLYPYIAYIVM